MSTAISIAARQPYGVQRVCAAWAIPRSSYYATATAAAATAATATATATALAATETRPTCGKRGPKTTLDDDALLALIRADLAASPFKGEGHRKVWARLHHRAGHAVGRNRILRLMRRHHLLSPHRAPTTPAKAHDGRICTDAPNERWATDGAKVLTAEGWLWVFTTVEHWNGELLGWHVCKRGDRYAAYEPVAQAVQRIFGHTRTGAARGVELRHDHGSQYLTDYFQGQSRHHGFTPSFALLGEPETNGVVERFNRTFKEQIIHGHIYRDRAELAAALAAFAKTYNEQWLLEKLAYCSPNQARRDYYAAQQINLPLAA
jgi:putative transposase